MSRHLHKVVFDGHREIDALLLRDSAWARRKILGLWSPGVTVATVAGRAMLLLRLAEPKRMKCATALGLPLISEDQVLFGCPTAAPERSMLPMQPGDVVIAEGGELRVLTPSREELEPAEWLDVSGFSLVPTATLAAPPPLHAPPALVKVHFDLRAALGQAGSPESKSLAAALTEAQIVPRPPWWRRAAMAVLRWFQGEERPALPPGQAQPPPTATGARVSAWLARKQDEYVRRLLTLFERDEVEEALRRAVPLNRTPQTGTPSAAGSSLPSRRTTLAPSHQARGQSGGSIQLAGGVYEQLMQRYRAAAAALELKGRIDEAAFVLADLLEAPSDAIALYERHQRHAQAAKLAEARNLDPALQVRLYFLAKDPARAVLIARQRDVFAAAVARLEASDKAAGASLRLLWGDHLARVGDYAGAFSVVSKVTEARELALKWLNLGAAGEGPEAAQLRIRRLDFEQSQAEAVFGRVVADLKDTSPEHAPTRAAIAQALLSGTEPSALFREPLRREAIRALIRDEASYGIQNTKLFDMLLRADDGALRVDMPAIVPGVRPLAANVPMVFERDRTALAPYDAVPLPGGRMLVALGENGVAVLNREGRISWRTEVPALRLVISWQRNEVLALARRTDLMTVSRISLAPKQAAYWCDLPPQFVFADTFGNGVWFVVQNGHVVGLDTLGNAPSVLFRVPRSAPGYVMSLSCSERALAVLTGANEMIVRERFVLSTLRPDATVARVPVQNALRAGAIDTERNVALAMVRGASTSEDGATDPAREVAAWHGAAAERTFFTAGRIQQVAVSGIHMATVVEVAGGIEVVHNAEPPLRFPGATSVRCRWHELVLTCVSDTGRIVSFDASTRRIVWQHSARVGR